MTEPALCGTIRAYQRHVRHREPADDACREAKRLDSADRRAANVELAREQDRESYRRRRAGETTPEAPCGTNAAYQRHMRRREEVDQACRDAHNADNRERRANRT